VTDRVHAHLHANPLPDFDRLDLAELRRRHGKKWRSFDRDVIAAWIADMDFPPPETVTAALERVIHDADFGYPDQIARTAAIEAFCAHMAQRHGWTVEPGSVELLTDVMQGAYVALDRFSAPGDGVATLTPIYPPFLECVRDTRRRGVCVTLLPDPKPGTGRFEIDFERLRDQASGNVRILLLSSPHNPTGRVFTRDELESLADIACRNDLFVISDEIHADLLYDGRQHIPFASLAPEVAARTLTLNSASKSFNIAGLRLAVAVFGSAGMRHAFLEAAPHGLRGGPNTMGLAAATAAWREGGPWLDALRTHLQGNRDRLGAFLARHIPAIRCLPAEGTYLAWLDCRGLGLEPSPWRHFLEHGRIALSDGADFGDGGDGHVRLNFATSRPILEQILERMRTCLS